MEIISMNELLTPLGKRIRKILTGSELLLAYELSKYARMMLGKEFILGDVTVSRELTASEHFSFVILNGLDVGFAVDRAKLTNYAEKDRNDGFFFKQTVQGVKFKKDTPEEVVYEYDFDINANDILFKQNRATAYISLVAFLLVRAYKEGQDFPKLTIGKESYNQQEAEYSDLYILKLYGNKLLDPKVTIIYSQAWGYQPEWEAYVLQNRQRGVMARPYTTTEKYRHLNKNFEVGDVVLYYRRTKGAQGKTINKLTACYPAVIRYFDQNTIRFEYYPMVSTQLTHVRALYEVTQNFEDEKEEHIYTHDDFNRFTKVIETVGLTEIGIGDTTFVETQFIVKPLDFDGTMQYLKTPNGVDYLWLSTLDTIYAVFEDRGIDYNRDKFLQTHFSETVPVYEQYRQALAATAVPASGVTNSTANSTP